jgi:hypothetical protein
MVVSKKHEHECTVLTAGAQGDIRVHGILRPPRYMLKPPLEMMKAGGRKILEWRPTVRFIRQIVPSTAEPLPGLGPKHFRTSLQGAKAISSLGMIPRGRNTYNILASDESGRMSVHMKNGTLIGSLKLNATTGIQQHALSKTWSAMSVDKKLMIFESRHRVLQPVFSAATL